MFLNLDAALSQRLKELLKPNIENAKCDLVCTGLSSHENEVCRHTCRLPQADKEYSCGLKTCSEGCLTACFSSGTKSTITWFRRDGCRVSWGSKRRENAQESSARTNAHFILVGQDPWGKFNVIRSVRNANTFVFTSPNSGKWTRLILFLVGQTGLEDRAVMPLDLPLDCQQEQQQHQQLQQQPQQSQHVQKNSSRYYDIILVIAVVSILAAAVAIVVIVLYQLRKSPSIGTKENTRSQSNCHQLFETASISHSETYISYQIQDYKIYEDFSFTTYNSYISVV